MRLNIDPSIVGTWKWEPPDRPGEFEFIHYSEDGCIVHFSKITFLQDGEERVRFVPMRGLILRKDGEDHVFTIIPQSPGHEMWMNLTRKDGTLLLRRGQRNFPELGMKTFEFLETNPDEYPEWYEERLKKALQRIREEHSVEQSDD